MTAQALPYRETPESPQNRAGEPRKRPPVLIECSGCEHQWTGLSAAHCSGCHVSFTSVAAFDRHRRGGQCLSPVEVGLVPANRDWPGWSLAGSWEGPES
jgi:hypothetical protein